MSDRNKLTWTAGAGGFFVGAFIGYLYRPPAFLIGQLPFKYVISRGTTLKGLDQMYIPVAEASFNYLLGGGIAGAILAVAAVVLLRQRTR